MKLFSPLPGPVRPLPHAGGPLFLKGDSRGEIEEPAFFVQGGPVPPDPPGLPVVARPRFARLGLALLIVLVATRLPAADPGIARKVAEVRAVAAGGPFQPDWDSLAKFEVPAWYQDAKFGIFIHWGAYSVPAFGNEWYPRNMYKAGSKEHVHHIETYGPLSRFGYKDFVPMFKAERFDAKRWAALFKAAGARYVVPVAEHHDGFPMYDYPFTDWSAVKMGPRRDVVGELAAAVRGEGLVFGASSHRIENWFFYGEGRKTDSDVNDERFAGLYGPAADREASEKGATPPTQEFLDDWLARSATLVDRYQPQLVWFDWWIAQPPVHANLKTFAAFYYNRGKQWGKGVAINYKKHGGESFPDTAGVLDIERGQLATMRPAVLADRHLGLENVLGLRTEPRVQVHRRGRGRPRGHREQERQPAAQHRSATRRHDPRARGGDAARDRGLALGERGGDLRHSAVERLRRGPDRGRGGPVRRREAQALHLAGRALHHSRRAFIRRGPRLARGWPARHSFAREGLGAALPDDPERGAPGLR